MNTRFLPQQVYQLLFSLLGLVYITGLFVPLVDNDSAHHASIALHMHLTGDYVSLIDQNGDYLDKPHMLFWLAALSYKIFGVTGFAYKLPSLLFTIVGTYATYRLGQRLYNKETGRLSALIVASAFAYMLANTDVRMDAILTACIALACWQLVEFIDTRKLISAAGAGLSLAVGFSTKGHIAVFVPALAALFYIIYLKKWSLLYNWKWLVLLTVFAIGIAPVVYSYYLQYNLHPEKVVRGRSGINGIAFILFNQSISRFSGEMGHDAKNDYLFFFHSFLWAFAPWSVLTYIAVVNRIKTFTKRTEEWATTGSFLLVALVVSLSGFKLPHYLNIVFPLAAIMAAVLILGNQSRDKWIRIIYTIQGLISILLLLLAAVINTWAFPVTNAWIVAGVVVLLAVVFYFYKSEKYSRLQKSVAIPVATMALVFFLLNTNFYPKLLKYQAGQTLAESTKGKVNPSDVYILPASYSASYVFYSKSKFQPFDDSLLNKGRRVWILTEPAQLDNFKSQGYSIGEVHSATHYRVTKLNIKFVDPARRDLETWQMLIAEVTGKR